MTGMLGGAEYSVSYQVEDFENSTADGLLSTFSESIRDGRPLEMSLPGGKKVKDLNKTFEQLGITPNSYVYLRYTGPSPWLD